MNTKTIPLHRTNIVLKPDQSRVLLRPFTPVNSHRVGRIITRILALPEEQVGPLLEEVSAEFAQRHKQIRDMFLRRFEQVRGEHVPHDNLSEERKLLIGSYFLAEYSLESAALFNPSIVAHPDQTGLPRGALRFVLSLRATGEGHISSITFRVGTIDANQRIEVEESAGFLKEPRQVPNSSYEMGLFTRKLSELKLMSEFTNRVMDRLGSSFSMQELRSGIDSEMDKERHADGVLEEDRRTAKGIWMLAQSNYEVHFHPEQAFSERILFPATPSQSNGIEDARFVQFHDEDGNVIYYATFTAFDGRVIMPELVETKDFLHFRFITLNGPAARNKGMALFPRKINGRYAMLSRQDNESIHLMYSDNIHFWNEHRVLLKPAFSWELVQLGNCGSPIETEFGWLVLSHGVGALRKYCIGAFLLDLKDPSRVIGRLREPLLQPDENERAGYVPNVVYTCGALVHGSELIIPYGLADHATGFAIVRLSHVLAAMHSEES